MIVIIYINSCSIEKSEAPFYFKKNRALDFSGSGWHNHTLFVLRMVIVKQVLTNQWYFQVFKWFPGQACI